MKTIRAVVAVGCWILVGACGPKPGETSAIALALSTVEATDVTSSSAVIQWSTNLVATSAVEYGLTANYGMATPMFGLTTSHAVELQGLQPATLYHFTVVSSDSAGTLVTSGDSVFTTSGVDGGGGDGGRGDGGATAECPAGSLQVLPSESLDALVASHDAGTTFCLLPGTHHDSVVSLKDGDTFTSPSGTTTDGVIENGATTLTGWKQVTVDGVAYWTAAGGTPLPPTYDSTKCETAFPGCFYPQNLYFNGADYAHVLALSQVTSGTWFYDFTGSAGPINNVYLSDDPTGQTVELGVLSHAFNSSTAAHVTVQGLIVEKYASVIQSSAIWAQAPDWLIQNNEVRLNHANGIGGRDAPGIQILNNNTHDNGDLGIGGGGLSGVVSHNAIVHNNIDHTLAGFGAGGFKVGGSFNLLVSYNLVQDNLGNGLHADAWSDGVTFDHNTVSGNLGQGIREEISNNGAITNNVVYANGIGSPNEPGMKSAQIASASSSHETIENNVVAYAVTSSGGIEVGYSTARGGCDAGCTIPVGMKASGNLIYLAGTLWAATLLDTSDAGEGRTTASDWEVPGIFDSNTYCVTALPWTATTWLRSTDVQSYDSVDLTQWQDAGQDVHGSISTQCPPAPSP
jgi:hypothetical protein